MKAVIIAALLVFACTGLAADQDSESFVPWPVLELKPGVVFTAIDSEAGFTSQGGRQTKIDMEDKLGLDSEVAVFRADALIRLGTSQRHRIDLSYAGYYRSAESSLTEGVEIGG